MRASPVLSFAQLGRSARVPDHKWSWFGMLVVLGTSALVATSTARAQGFNEVEAQAFTDRYCSSCHNDVDKEGGLGRLTASLRREKAIDLAMSRAKMTPESPAPV